MRIAVSGTHSAGKSTLVDEFLRAHKNFAHEPEPYTVLVEDFGEEFAAEPCEEDFYRQLEFNVERLKQHGPGEHVIYERCPIDFLAYLAALKCRTINNALALVLEGIQHLDLIVYLPLDDDDDNDAEFPKLRKAVDRKLSAIFREEEFELLSETHTVEAKGSTTQRLRIVEQAMNSLKL